jgi:hypothetical protein
MASASAVTLSNPIHRYYWKLKWEIALEFPLYG